MAVTSIPALLNSSQQHQPWIKGSSYAPLEPGLWKTAMRISQSEEKGIRHQPPGRPRPVTTASIAFLFFLPPLAPKSKPCTHLDRQPDDCSKL